MSAEALLIILAILYSSFLGSWHCAAMCGPIASLAAHKNSLIFYQLGRGISYFLVGALGGLIGSFFLSHDFEYIRIGSGVMFAILLIIFGLQTLRGRKPLGVLNMSWFHIRFFNRSSGFAMGLFSVFLPCAWLYSYLLAAVATKSAYSGAMTLFLFWLGSLPAMSALSLFMKKSIQMANKKKQRVAGALLVVAGIYSLASFYFLDHRNHSVSTGDNESIHTICK